MAPGSTDTDHPALVHVTVCRQHLKAVRKWLSARTGPDDEVMTCGTEALMRSWGQIKDDSQVPTYSAVSMAV